MKDTLAGVAVTVVLFILFSLYGTPTEEKSNNDTQQPESSGVVLSGGLGDTTDDQQVASKLKTEITQAQSSTSTKYICVKSFQIKVYASDGSSLLRKATIHEGDIYETGGTLLISSEPAIHLEQVNGDCWIEISPNTLNKYFIKTN